MAAALFTAGLGDVIRTCYLTGSYQMISETQQPVPVIVASHNPYTIEIFRHHRNARNFILYDLGHKYAEFLAAGLRGAALNQAICEFAGISYHKPSTSASTGIPLVFHAPDNIDTAGHIVFQPFAGQSDRRSLPASLVQTIVGLLRKLPWQVYIVTRSYPRTGPSSAVIHGVEDAREFAGGNITVLDDLSVPATLNLIKSCRAFVGSWSSLQQAAWFENKPVAVFYPEILRPDVQGYGFGVHRENTLARVFAKADPKDLSAFLNRW